MPRFAAMALAMAVVVGPWMGLNYTRYGIPDVAQRGGEILMMRALKNEMTAEEARGAIYAWAAWKVRRPIGEYLGFSDADLTKGGRLQRLNIHGDDAFVAEDWAAEMAGRPEAALTFYTAARAERVKLLREMTEAGVANPHQMSDRELRNRALSLIAADPMNHLRMSPLFMWRGLWSRSPAGLTTIVLYLAMVLGFFVFMGTGLVRRDPVILAYTLAATGIVTFFALLTQFHPRFGDVVLPVIYTCSLGGCAWALV
jgi:hypothetical protein